MLVNRGASLFEARVDGVVVDERLLVQLPEGARELPAEVRQHHGRLRARRPGPS